MTQEHESTESRQEDTGVETDVATSVRGDQLDAASRSLSEALKVSFWVLRLVMIALVIVFVTFSGWEKVEEGSIGVRMRFGAPTGVWVDSGNSFKVDVLQPGAHFTWPEPMERIVKVPVTTQKLELKEAFSQEKIARYDREREIGAWLLTGDRNLIHGVWTVEYRVDPETPFAVQRFIANVSSSLDHKQMLADTERVVRSAAERGIVHLIAGVQAVDAISGRVGVDRIKKLIQQSLDQMRSGITVTAVTYKNSAPFSVAFAFEQAARADQERGRRRTEAEQAANKILIDAAGEGYPQVVEAVEAYEKARIAGDDATAQTAAQRVFALLDSDEVTGEAKKIVSEARSERSTLVKQIESELETFRSYLPLYKQNPHILKTRLWEDTRQAILESEGVETFYLPSGVHLYLEVNPDPSIIKRRENERTKEAVRKATQ